MKILGELPGRDRRLGSPQQSAWASSLFLPWRKAVIAAVVGTAAFASAVYLTPTDRVLPSALLACSLAWAALVDVDRRILPNLLTIGLIVTGLLLGVITSLDALIERTIGAAAGYGSIVGLATLYSALRKRDGIGRGDAKLLGAGGAWLGWPGLPMVMLIASTAALSFIVVHAALSRSSRGKSGIAFGPFLALGIWAAWILIARS